MTELRNGVRLKCEACGAEAIVLKAAPASLLCCGQTPVAVAEGRPAGEAR